MPVADTTTPPYLDALAQAVEHMRQALAKLDEARKLVNGEVLYQLAQPRQHLASAEAGVRYWLELPDGT